MMNSRTDCTGTAYRSGFGYQRSIKRRQGVALAKKRLGNYLSVLTRNGEGVCRFHALTHLSEPTRTYFPKSSLNTLLLTLLPFRGRSRTLANDPEQPISRRKSVWSISSRAQSGRFRRAQKKGRALISALPTESSEVFRSPTRRGHLDAIRSPIHLVTSCSFQTTVREANCIC